MEWISVKNRLPEEENAYYLICMGGRTVRVGMYENGYWSYCSGIYMTELAAKPGYRVTHWMPLPEPPKGEKEKEH